MSVTFKFPQVVAENIDQESSNIYDENTEKGSLGAKDQDDIGFKKLTRHNATKHKNATPSHSNETVETNSSETVTKETSLKLGSLRLEAEQRGIRK